MPIENGLKSHTDIHEKLYEPRFEKFETAIEVIDLHKRYRTLNQTKVILNGLNLKCYAGQFYILYGTRCSGKSALVKTILNLESFNRGVINIFGQNILDYHTQIGYMPQLTGLDASLTVVETISYFAILHGIDKHECVKNFSDLQSPMTITNRSVLVRNLTLDQTRVLSFYIAMIASPKLIVLDQPFSGCDPLYKNFFWQKLRSLVDNDGTTIFMTCSDEIDMNQPDVIGYLRNDASELVVLIWGAISTICHFSGALLGALPLCVQNRNGLMDRMENVGVSHLSLQLVHWTTRTFFIVLQTFLILGCTALLLTAHFSTSEFLVSWFVIILQTLCGFSYGILLFGILQKRVPIILYVIISELIVSTMCGFFWNHYALGSFLKTLTVVIPHSSVAKFLNKVIVENVSIFEDLIWIAFLSPTFWMISTFAIYIILFELNK